MGRKSKFHKGIEMGERFPTVLRLEKRYKEGTLSAPYLKMFRRQMKRAVPKKRNKITRQEFEAGFRIGMRRGRK